ncbi:MAG: hypothetical protein ACRDHC_00680 [Actinomycetota bacterium]
MDLRGRRWLVMSVVVGLALVAASCGDDDDGTADGGTAADNTVSATLADYSITLDSSSAPAGDLTFEVTNDAGQVHEFVVLKTDLAQDALPTDDAGDVDEAGDPGIELVDEIEDIEGGATPTLSVTLDPGSYVLICNLPGHYALGMHAGFSVE